MASVRREIHVDADPAEVWDALADWGALHVRLVPGFAVDTQLDGPDRIVTFANGLKVRELLIDCDHEARRLAWTVVDGPYRHHNGVAQVFAEGDGARCVWTADVLPHDAAPALGEAMARGVEVVAATMSRT
jgi:hypothetical protein